MTRLLCKFGIHDWDYHYWFDHSVKWPRFKVTNALRICKRCEKRQWSKPAGGSNKIKYDKHELY